MAATPAAAAAGTDRLPRLGEPLPYCEQSGCIYLDYNATSPIFPEVSGGWMGPCRPCSVGPLAHV